MPEDQVTPPGNQDQDQSLGWRAALPQEFKEHEFVKTFTKPGDFVKSALEIKAEHDNLKTKLEGAIFKPGENATDAEKADYYKALGRPEKPEGYEVKIPEGLPLDPGVVAWFQNTAFKRGLPKDVGEGLANDYFEKTKSDLLAINDGRERQFQESNKSLKGEWKDQYQANLDLANTTARRIGGDEFMDYLKNSGVGLNVLMVKAFHKIGTMFSEAAFEKGGTPPKEPLKTPGGELRLTFPSMDK